MGSEVALGIQGQRVYRKSLECQGWSSVLFLVVPMEETETLSRECMHSGSKEEIQLERSVKKSSQNSPVLLESGVGKGVLRGGRGRVGRGRTLGSVMS